MKRNQKNSKKRTLRYRVRLFGKRADITTLLRNTLIPVISDYSDIQNAIANGIDPKIAYNIPQPKLSALRRYERARAMYDEYKRAHETLQADKICSIVQPTTPKHLVHLIFQSTSNKNEYAYTHYRVVVAQQNNKLYNISCDCPDFMNNGGVSPCKHALFACMLLRDKAVVELR